ncbi:tRNA (adenosine(37)-N6)-dimethylallyltransferase MiaA [Caulobacter sp. 17J80-11]|uniref:tRNA (adenosine(37)-N6)-dimethylallyltransferase MiaA n=1 Tax=Caulobacter sp. 17J80-11 TaxID=2763502 RepID=UPI00165396BB|nr:tRNA (adenosine(37)-N6)-dimethylallyltransferase MiaA [Caulobacter sp. 17J80-11]MBC6981061.1 tRNA (adenosine(37)-N6)-dimethylallyltransferase MiaA [Caulobacter sp. 17J80-11]
MSDSAKVRLIAGPTASGKSALALRVAEATGGVIVNADALQIYRDLRVLSARPSAEEEARVPHRLYGVADASETWSVGRWLEAATATLDEIADEGRTAVVVGGTGLYFRALTRGLADVPAIPEEVRAEARARLEQLGEDAFRAELRERDPAAAARIAPGDRQRLARAFEVHAATGRALSDWQADTQPRLAAGSYEALVIEPPRHVLYARCDARFDAMLAEGALEEARALLARGLGPNLPAMKAVGLRELGRHLSGELSLVDAAALGRQETRRYAKRQLTWLRNQTPEWPRFCV